MDIDIFNQNTVKSATINLLDNIIKLRTMRSFIHIAGNPNNEMTTLGLNIANNEKRPIIYIDTSNNINLNMKISDNVYIFQTNKFSEIINLLKELPRFNIKAVILDNLNNIIFPEEEDKFEITEKRYLLFNKYIREILDQCYSKMITLIAFNSISDYSNKPYCYSSQLKEIIDHDLLITEVKFFKNKLRMKLLNIMTKEETELELER